MFRILTPVDFSEGSTKASHYALQLAAKVPGAKLLLLHCFQDYLADADPVPASAAHLNPSEQLAERVLHRNETEALEQLEALYEELQHKARSMGSSLYIERTFIHGLPEEEIPEQAERFRPALVVMSTKGEASFGRAVFGTVSTKVIEEARVPVLTVPNQFNGAIPGRILYATDFGKTDVADIDRIRQLFGHLQPMIYCVHISDDPEEDREKLLELQQNLQHGAPENDIRYALLEGSDVAEALQDFARSEAIDLLALTTQERSTFDSLFNPSLAKKMVLHAPLPVLVFKGKV
ncbi:universal stress protein [Pontibacter ramchanderi]|uniref:Nucleotide-binding universal stress UspA family protein n=1 Tax=Pontibacter ramchanderi TaxID=1179743 RepID=A0A2N3UAS6_9BACT|nr:universal stress protein [Pontibacter ramchanderi]PKV66467.1 nucleotide-binding universal stress UspA family protein [Pontibacter ramchanderi]